MHMLPWYGTKFIFGSFFILFLIIFYFLLTMKCVILPPFPPFHLLWLQMVLERYFSLAGQESELVLPKNLDLQERLQRGPPKDIDFFPEEFEG
jgi:hypothetical protein